jgi:flagellar assembly factor FliW
MPVTFESVRFGTVEVSEDEIVEFPLGLIGLGGLRYAILDRNPGTGFFWLHSVEDEALALPIVNPQQFFGDFVLEMYEEDQERTGIKDPAGVEVFVTVRARPNPVDITANLRAPLVIHEKRGYQVLNAAADAQLQAPLFATAKQAEPEPVRSVDAA